MIKQIVENKPEIYCSDCHQFIELGDTVTIDNNIYCAIHFNHLGYTKDL